jgi:ADP-ribose pyrophosphatase YjhB (NUDIX family)
VLCAVIDDEGCVLLSQRGDLNTWALPGGRLDAGERLEDAAAREVREETGINANVQRAVTLYYYDGWQRMNVLYAGFPLGGELNRKTRETRANRYFAPDVMPTTALGAHAALAAQRPPPRVVRSSRQEYLRLRLRFGWRWLVNWLSRHPEPKFPKFDVRAVAVILGEGIQDTRPRVLTLPGESSVEAAVGLRSLPRVVCDGKAPPWEQLSAKVQTAVGIKPGLQWVGLWQDAERGIFEFVFAATVPEAEFPGGAQWTVARNAAFGDRDAVYVRYVRPSYARDPVWTLANRDDTIHMITLKQQVKEASL